MLWRSYENDRFGLSGDCCVAPNKRLLQGATSELKAVLG